MSENFFGEGLNQPDRIDNKREEPVLSDEDRVINDEINKIGEDHFNSRFREADGDYKKQIERIKNTRDTAERIIAYIDAYIGKYPNKASKEMSLDEFTDLINSERDFNTSIRNLINKWLDDHEGKINLEKSLRFFLDSIFEEWKKCQNLLDPGPEKSEENKE